MFLRKAGQPFKIVVNEKVFGLANKIENQDIVWLVEIPKSATIYQVIALIIKTQHAQKRYLRYRSLLELLKLVYRIEIKGAIFTKHCGKYMKSYLQWKLSQILIIRATQFLEEIYSDLRGLLPSI